MKKGERFFVRLGARFLAAAMRLVFWTSRIRCDGLDEVAAARNPKLTYRPAKA